MRSPIGLIPGIAFSLLALAVTGCSNVSLRQFYARVDPTAQIAIDPIGGFMLLYWVDAGGTACRGAPGQSGPAPDEGD